MEFEVPALNHQPTFHDHKLFLSKARRKPGFAQTYTVLLSRYLLARRALSRAGAKTDYVQP